MVQKHIEKGGKAILFTHRSELLNQSGGTFENFGLKPHFIKQGIEPDLNASLHIAMVETFNRRKIDYAKFINGLAKSKIRLDRKVLAELAYSNPEVFKSVVKKVQSSLA